jgi:hypothetical protein
MGPEVYTKRMTYLLFVMLAVLAVVTFNNVFPDKEAQQEAAVLRAYGN